MSRLSGNEYRDGMLWNGYDYDNQCWVIDGIIQDCNHPEYMRCICFGRYHAGEKSEARK